MNSQYQSLSLHGTWPVLRSYEGECLRRIAMPVGGIGTGCVTLGGRGDLRDWEIVNRPAQGFRPNRAFFAIHTRDSVGKTATRALEGPIDPADVEGPDGAAIANHGLPRFANCRFDAAYPLAQIALNDPQVPVQVRLEVFNPLIPGDSASSSLPVAIIRMRVTNTSPTAVDVGLMGMLTNFIGTDGSRGQAKDNRNSFKNTGGVTGLFMSSDGVPRDSGNWGTLAFVITSNGPAQTITHRAQWPDVGWNTDLSAAWDAFATHGKFEGHDAESGGTNDQPTGSLGVHFSLRAGEEQCVTFLIGWHFPHRQTWSPGGKAFWVEGPRFDTGGEIIGNHYTQQFTNAWDVVQKVAADLPRLESQTVAFTEAFCRATLPEAVKEAALFNLSTLRTQTCFRTPDGHLFGWEGVYERFGSCLGSCTHVWNYELALSFLFSDLARSMREVEFAYATTPDGLMNFRVHLPLEKYATSFGLAAADGQAGCIIKLFREWRLSGNDSWLATLWPKAKKAIEFCWITGGWDADQDGVMEGCQHNTMDVEYYGPNPQMTGWYIAALHAGSRMADAMGDAAFAEKCRQLAGCGACWIDQHLFNGDYYEHQVQPPKDAGAIAPGLRHPSMGAKNLADPAFQLGQGCLVDQLVGPAIAHASGLGEFLDPAHVRKTLDSIVKFNRQQGFSTHFNAMRSFALGDESALLMASYPRGHRPQQPFPYHSEVMTGFEYAAAVGMLQNGMIGQGVQVITDIRARYDGRKRNPFNEAECGRHYARAMCSWGAVIALTGFSYQAHSGTMSFAMPVSKVLWFWSTGAAWGTIEMTPEAGDSIEFLWKVGGGAVDIARLHIGTAAYVLPQKRSFGNDDKIESKMEGFRASATDI